MAAFVPPAQSASAYVPDFTAHTPPDREAGPFPPSAQVKSMPRPGRRSQHRFSGDFRGSNGAGTGGATGPAGFEGSRSPPSAKNTSHVPCKFFKIGQCQAGRACPFSHATDASAFEQPCKYFSRGNCKFGHKCALLHVLPNGRIVNRPNASLGQLNIGNRVEPAPYHQESVLGNSLAQQPNMGHSFGHQIPQLPEIDLTYQPSPALQPYDIVPSISHQQHATPRDDTRAPLSPPMHLSALDAPLPASFDSQGISYAFRHWPAAASVPSKFESPPQSLPQKNGAPLETLRNLHESAYGRETRIPGLATSPSGPEWSTQRTMHSQRVLRPKMVSASLPRPNMADEWETDDLLFGGEEDYLPSNLSHLLSAEERTRRIPARLEDSQTARDQPGVGEFSRHIGSPSTASPSRFAEFFNKQKEEQVGGSTSFVGSPIGRSAQLGSSPGPRSLPRSSGDLAFAVSSPPRASATSMLSQQLQRVRIGSDGNSVGHTLGTNGATSGSRHPSNSRGPMDRAVSSSSMTTTRIEEEQPDFLFAFDDIGSSKQPPPSASTNNPWNPPRNAKVGSVGDGRKSLDAKDEMRNKKIL